MAWKLNKKISFCQVLLHTFGLRWTCKIKLRQSWLKVPSSNPTERTQSEGLNFTLMRRMSLRTLPRPSTWPRSSWLRTRSSAFSRSFASETSPGFASDFRRCCCHCCCCCWSCCRVAAEKSCCCRRCCCCGWRCCRGRWRLESQCRRRCRLRRRRRETRTGPCGRWGWSSWAARSSWHRAGRCSTGLTGRHWGLLCPWVQEGTGVSSLPSPPFWEGGDGGGRGANKHTIYFGCRH